MATVPENLEKILQARYGEEVRGAIYDSIKNIYSFANGEIQEELYVDVVSLATYPGVIAHDVNGYRIDQISNWYHTGVIPVIPNSYIYLNGTLGALAREGYVDYFFMSTQDESDITNNFNVTKGSFSSKVINGTLKVPNGAFGLAINIRKMSDDHPSLRLVYPISEIVANLNAKNLYSKAVNNRYNNAESYFPVAEHPEHVSGTEYIDGAGMLRTTSNDIPVYPSQFIKVPENGTLIIQGLMEYLPSSNVPIFVEYSYPEFSPDAMIQSIYSNKQNALGPIPYNDSVYLSIDGDSGVKYVAMNIIGKSTVFWKENDHETASLISSLPVIRERRKKSVFDIVGRLFESRFSSLPIKIKLIGDSITAGMGGTGFEEDGDEIIPGWHVNTKGYCWANLMKQYLEDKGIANVYNYGCSGIDTKTMSDNFYNVVGDDDDLVICMLGTNDRANSNHLSVETYLSAFVRRCIAKNIPVVLMSAPPATVMDENKNESSSPKRIRHMEDIDNSVHNVANSFGMEYISLYDEIRRYCMYSGTPLESLLASDGLHPNDTGYELMFRIIMARLGYQTPVPGATWVTKIEAD